MVSNFEAPPDAVLRGAVAKFMMRMMPLMVLMYIVNQIDRSNIGFAKQQLERDLGIGSAAYGLGAGLFFLGYVLLEVPSNMMLERVGARKWLTRIMVSWGAVVVLMAFIKSDTQFYLLRVLLGATEAGFFPGIVLCISQWLPDRYRGRAMALLLFGSGIASVINGPLSGALLELNGVLGLRGWQWMFLVEGGLSVLCGLATGLFFVSKPDGAAWLSVAEKTVLNESLSRDADLRNAASHDAHSLSARFKLLLNGDVMSLFFVYFAIQLTTYAVSFWLPTIVRRLGNIGDFQVGLISSIPFIFGMIAMYSLGLVTDRNGKRSVVLGCAMLLAGVGTILATVGSAWFAIVAICIATIGFKCAGAQFWALAQFRLDTRVAAVGIALISSLGNIGGFVAPTVFGILEQRMGSTEYGLYGLTIVSILAAFLVLLRMMSPKTGGVPEGALEART